MPANAIYFCSITGTVKNSPLDHFFFIFFWQRTLKKTQQPILRKIKPYQSAIPILFFCVSMKGQPLFPISLLSLYAVITGFFSMCADLSSGEMGSKGTEVSEWRLILLLYTLLLSLSFTLIHHTQPPPSYMSCHSADQSYRNHQMHLLFQVKSHLFL